MNGRVRILTVLRPWCSEDAKPTQRGHRRALIFESP
jgi:hypothetical protein